MEESISGEEWLKIIMEPKLSDAVPKELLKLFEIARSSMVYGYFFYPLYMLAAQQLFRVAETAVTFRCEQLGAPKLKNFKRKVDWLASKGHVSKEAVPFWNGVIYLRNSASHPTSPIILTQNYAIGIVTRAVEDINALFS